MTDKHLPFKFFQTPFADMWKKGVFYAKYEPNSEYRYVDTDAPGRSINTDDWVYRFNEYGFRSGSFDQRSEFNVLISGCSITVGIGVDYEYTWGQQLRKRLEEYLGKSVTVWNLAQSSCSPDYTTRSIYKTIDIFNPDLVAVCWPCETRFELPSNNPDTLGLAKDYALGEDDYPKLLVREGWHEAQLEKNIIFLKMICEQHGAKLVHGPGELTDFGIDPSSNGRDGSHPGIEWHKEYADLVFKHFKDKY